MREYFVKIDGAEDIEKNIIRKGVDTGESDKKMIPAGYHISWVDNRPRQKIIYVTKD